MLEQLGDVFLATRLLQRLFLGTDPLLSQKAYDKLLKNKEKTKSALLPLLATAVLRSETEFSETEFFQKTRFLNILIQLIHVLIEKGYQNEAFMLGLIRPPTQRPHALMIELAYHSSWWQTFTALLWFLSDEKQQLWLGFKAQDKGNYAAAINFWRDAGAEGLT